MGWFQIFFYHKTAYNFERSEYSEIVVVLLTNYLVLSVVYLRAEEELSKQFRDLGMGSKVLCTSMTLHDNDKFQK